MTKISEYHESIPDYALSYLVNADDSGVTDEDKQTIDAYMSQFYQESARVKGSVIISVDSTEGNFTHYPAFGLACECYDCTILILSD